MIEIFITISPIIIHNTVIVHCTKIRRPAISYQEWIVVLARVVCLKDVMRKIIVQYSSFARLGRTLSPD